MFLELLFSIYSGLYEKYRRNSPDEVGANKLSVSMFITIGWGIIILAGTQALYAEMIYSKSQFLFIVLLVFMINRFILGKAVAYSEDKEWYSSEAGDQRLARHFRNFLGFILLSFLIFIFSFFV